MSSGSLLFRPETPAAEAALVREANQGSLKEGETMYVIAYDWWKSWTEFSGFYLKGDEDLPRPAGEPSVGPIDNSPILRAAETQDINQFAGLRSTSEKQLSKDLKRGLMENRDYVLLKADAWQALVSWYHGGPAIPRKVIYMTSCSANSAMVELYQFTISVSKISEGRFSFSSNDTTVEISQASSVRQLREAACSDLNLAPDKCRLWLVNGPGEADRLLDNLEIRLDAAFLSDGCKVLVEQRNSSGQWPKDLTASAPESPTSPPRRFSFSSPYSPESASKPGMAGLRNIGNTCFMNSGLQCLSKTKRLTEYFLSDEYKREINRSNPLGQEGQIAEKYGELVKDLWSGKSSAYTPSDFKWTLGKFAPQFMGYQQQDSQEFLAFLLDGLHEDLNRVIEKPYTETVEPKEGESDNDVAQRAWQTHLLRNQSIIVDLFQGQLKSKVTCPDCGNKSITFDPFMYLSLPILQETHRFITVVFVPVDSAKLPVKCSVKVPKGGTVSNLRSELGELFSIDATFLHIAEVWDNHFGSHLSDQSLISGIRDNDTIVAYALDSSILDKGSSSEELITLYVMNRKKGGQYSYRDYDRFGLPFIVNIHRSKSSNNDLRRVVEARLNRFMLRSENSEDESLFDIRRINQWGTSADDTPLPLNDDICALANGSYIGLDWADPDKYKSEEMDRMEIHSSFVSESDGRSGSVPLEDCIKLFIRKEKLGEEDMWYCPHCKDFRQAMKEFSLWKLPDILVIHLKKFSYTKYWRDKIDVVVDFPIQDLDLSDYVQHSQGRSCVYDLFGVSNHMGGLGGGHYTAHVKCEDGKWRLFNDCSVSEASEDDLVSTSSYLLFYERKEAVVAMETE